MVPRRPPTPYDGPPMAFRRPLILISLLHPQFRQLHHHFLKQGFHMTIFPCRVSIISPSARGCQPIRGNIARRSSAAGANGNVVLKIAGYFYGNKTGIPVSKIDLIDLVIVRHCRVNLGGWGVDNPNPPKPHLKSGLSVR